MHQVRVNQKAASRLASGHPWIFSSDILDRGDASPGETVAVTGHRGQFLGTAHHSSSSQIALRMLSGKRITADADFFADRIRRAQRLRDRVVTNTEAWRAVYSEGDLLPGLIVDNYAGVLVVQFLDQGMDAARETILAVLDDVYRPRAIVGRNDAAVRELESLPREKGVLRGSLDGPVSFRMNGLTFSADLLEGQKTGLYLDQRENYAALERYVRPGMKLLDCFTSTGGFALHAARAGASVEAIDSSVPALDAARRNAEANGLAGLQFRRADVMELLTSLVTARRRYDIVVLDPPAFAKSRSVRDGGLRGYREINSRALQLLEDEGLLVTCSCSHHVSESMLLETVAEAALGAGRTLRVIERRFQAQDHPVLLTVPESLYLKLLILQIA